MVSKTLHLFASELKSIREHPSFNNDIDTSALTLFFRHNCVPSPFSIYKGIYKLPPGSFISLSWFDLLTNLPDPTVYWSSVSEAQNASLASNDFETNLTDLDSLLKEVVSEQLISDVPLGAFLSGGIDSSLIVAIMSQVSSPVKTFTIGFNETGYNEAFFAKEIAEHLSTITLNSTFPRVMPYLLFLLLPFTMSHLPILPKSPPSYYLNLLLSMLRFVYQAMPEMNFSVVTIDIHGQVLLQ